MNRCAVFILLLALLVSSCTHLETPEVEGSSPPVPEPHEAQACPPEECFRKALDDRLSGNLPGSWFMLQHIREEHPGTLWAARGSFLLGLQALEDKPGLAEHYFRESLALTDIEDHALYRLAGALRAGRGGGIWGDRAYEALSAYDLLINKYPDSTLLAEALYGRAETLEEAGLDPAAIEAFEAFISSHPDHPLAAGATLRASALHLASGETDKAARKALALIVERPESSEARVAEVIIEDIRSLGAEIPELTRAQRYGRAERLFNASLYEEALDGLSGIVEAGPGPYYSETLMLAAVSKLRLKRYAEAEAGLKRYLEGKPSREEEKKALYWLSLASLKQAKAESLFKTVKALKEKFPKDPYTARAVFFTATYNENRGEVELALKAYEEVIKGYPGTPAWREALWEAGWKAYREGRYGEAYGTFTSEMERGSMPAEEKQRLLYWAGRSAEMKGLAEEAVMAYSRICGLGALNYYCHLATQRGSHLLEDSPRVLTPVSIIAPPPGVPDHGAEVLDTGYPRIYEERHYRAARELMTLGLAKEAAREALVLEKKYSRDRASLLELTRLFYDAGDYHRALKVYYRNFSVLTGGAKNPAEVLGIAFPMGVIEFIRENSYPGSPDPYLIAAVMREESAFNPETVSRAGAVGLMQIMPATGEFIAGKTGAEGFERADLFKPTTNVRFGAWYLAYLAERFDGDLVRMVAGYNAGPHVVQRWTGKLPERADEFIESIPYAETRAYTKRVLRSYTEYLRLAGGQGEDRSSERSSP